MALFTLLPVVEQEIEDLGIRVAASGMEKDLIGSKSVKPTSVTFQIDAFSTKCIHVAV